MYKTHGKEYCASHYINYDVVYKLVLKSYRKNKDEFRSFLDSKCRDRVPTLVAASTFVSTFDQWGNFMGCEPKSIFSGGTGAGQKI